MADYASVVTKIDAALAEAKIFAGVSPVTGFPAWRNGLPPNVFSPIANTARLGSHTIDRATIYTWNGLAAGKHQWYAALNGGHGAMENKVIGLDLSVNAPGWALFHPGSDQAAWGNFQSEPDGSAPYYKDGLPAARHTYFQTHVIASRNRVMAFGGYAVNQLAGTSPHVDGFDISTKTWDPAGTWPDSPITHWGVLTSAKDPRNEDVYVAGYGVHAKWTNATNKFATLVPNVSPAASWEYKGTVIDPKRNVWVWLTGKERNTIDLATMAYVTGRVTGALDDGSQYGVYENYAALVYDEDGDRYLQIVKGKCYSINPDTWVSTFMMDVPVAENGVQSRFAYFKEEGGVAYLPTFESNVLFMPTR